MCMRLLVCGLSRIDAICWVFAAGQCSLAWVKLPLHTACSPSCSSASGKPPCCAPAVALVGHCAWGMGSVYLW
jgi:hypothetical protein